MCALVPPEGVAAPVFVRSAGENAKDTYPVPTTTMDAGVQANLSSRPMERGVQQAEAAMPLAHRLRTRPCACSRSTRLISRRSLIVSSVTTSVVRSGTVAAPSAVATVRVFRVQPRRLDSSESRCASLSSTAASCCQPPAISFSLIHLLTMAPMSLQREPAADRRGEAELPGKYQCK